MNTPNNPTMLDQFAMAALTGLLSSQSCSESFYTPEKAAKDAYEIAQAMMKQRERVALERAQEHARAARRARERMDMEIEKQLDALQRKAETHYTPGV